jgi:beta-galactosidase
MDQRARAWEILECPQQTLYVPAPFLRRGSHEVVVFTVGGPTKRLRGLKEPVLDEMGSG